MKFDFETRGFAVVVVSIVALALIQVYVNYYKSHTAAPPSVPITEFVDGYAAEKSIPVTSLVGPTNEASKIMITLYWAGLCDGYKAAQDGGPTNLAELYEAMARKMDSTLNAANH